jgi:DNA-directed RNA polymerase specialized sigma24 family protein
MEHAVRRHVLGGIHRSENPSVEETSFFPGACFDDDAGLGELRSPDNEIRNWAWRSLFNHYEAALIRYAKRQLVMARFSADEDAVYDLLNRAWDELFESLPTLDNREGEVGVFNFLLDRIEYHVRYTRRSAETRRMNVISDLTRHGSDAHMTEAEYLDLFDHDPQPSVEFYYEQQEHRQRLLQLIAIVLDSLTHQQRRVAGLWFIYGFDTHAINAILKSKKLDNTVSRAKREVANGLSYRLWHLLTQHPADKQVMEFFLMVESFRNTDKDGDLTQTHPFVQYLHQIAPQPFPDVHDPRWYPLLITQLKGGSP